MNQTILDLFIAAGYSTKDIETFPIDTPIPPRKKIEVLSYNTQTGETEWKPVLSLFYKGNSDPAQSYQIFHGQVTFLVTGAHLLWSPIENKYIAVQDIQTSTFTVRTEIGNNSVITIVPIRESFPILDIEVADNFNYFSGGFVSHNSFGRTAALMSQGLRKLNPYLSRMETSMILINQIRDDPTGYSPMGPAEKTPGGRAVRFYSSWRARVSKMEDLTEKQVVVGNRIKVRNVKNKVGVPKRVAELDLYYASGFNPDNEYLDFIIDLEVIEKRGGWYYQEEWGLKAHGREEVAAFLAANPDRFEEAKAVVNKSFTSALTLDALRTEEPDEEEIRE